MIGTPAKVMDAANTPSIVSAVSFQRVFSCPVVGDVIWNDL